MLIGGESMSQLNKINVGMERCFEILPPDFKEAFGLECKAILK